MFDILADGISILNLYKYGILLFCIAATGMGYFTVKQTISHQIDTRIKWLMYFCTGSITLCAACYLLFFLGYFWHGLLQPGSYLILFFSIFVLIRGLWTGDIKITGDVYLLYFGLILFLLLIVRLSFLRHIILPSYSDSLIHYQVVHQILNPESNNVSKLSFGNLFGNYYHFGFHVLVAWLVLIAKIEPGNAISLLGQLFLVIAPLSVLLLAYVLNNRANSAIFAGLLATIGWPMPAFAVNWGKFPAVASLALLPALIALLTLYLGNTRKSRAIWWGIILVISIVLIHTRISICLALVCISYFLSKKLPGKNMIEFPQAVRLSLLYILSLWPVSQLIANFYLGFPLWIVFLILLPFAFQIHPKLSFGIFFLTTGLWIVTLLPPIVHKSGQMLLDRQFLEIMLYIPFSVMGGIGFEGMIRKLSFFDVKSRWIVATVLVGCVMLNIRNSASLFPDSCCNYFQENDRLAFQWLQENTSDDSLILISSFDDNDKVFGTDAGIWITPLIGVNTNKLPFNTSWHVSDVIKDICSSGAKETYIYAGGRQNSFDNAQLVQQKWIDLVYKTGETEIFQVSKCL